MKPEELSISGELFKELRGQINQALQNGIRRMRETHMDECSVGVKINIEILGDEPITKLNGLDTIRMDTLKIEGKVSLTVPMKGEVKMPTKLGMKCIGSGGGYIIMDNQISIEEILKEGGIDDDDDC